MKTDDFSDKVYGVVRQIPKGRVTSYGAIAEFLGRRGAARMVGWIMNRSHSVSPNIPAHRVVNRNGMLTGKHHFGGTHVMEDMLRSEGVEIINDKVQNFDTHFWHPAKALKKD